jgi:hypothetical protein
MDGISLYGATALASIATRRAFAAEAIARFTSIPLADASSLCDVCLTYVSILAELDAHEKCLVASGRLSLAQIAEGAKIANHYDPIAPGTGHDATLEQIGADYVANWLDRVTAPALIATE